MLSIISHDKITKSPVIIEVDFTLPLYDVGDEVGIEHPTMPSEYLEVKIKSVELERTKIAGNFINNYSYSMTDGDLVLQDEIKYRIDKKSE